MKVCVMIHLVGDSCQECRAFDSREKAFDAADKVSTDGGIPFFCGMLWKTDDNSESVEVQEIEVE